METAVAFAKSESRDSKSTTAFKNSWPLDCTDKHRTKDQQRINKNPSDECAPADHFATALRSLRGPINGKTAEPRGPAVELRLS